MGFLVWDGAYILSKFAFEHLELGGKTCVELGAGSALVSIVAHIKGAKHVVATDMSEYQPFINANIDRNIHDPGARKTVEVCELMWGQKSNIGKADVVFGSEILYLEEVHDKLIATLRDLMKEDSVAYFIYKDRGLNEHKFMAKAGRWFTIGEISKSLMDVEFQDEHNYHLLSLTIKKIANVASLRCTDF
ncbi:Methyltransferase-like protein 21B [Dipsacomyces acuminosporus]|nr:Methyltransferase-like protein 21B [Dipsacomyces acuminosporus]